MNHNRFFGQWSYLCILCLAIALMCSGSCQQDYKATSHKASERTHSIGIPIFSPDNNKIIFVYRIGEGSAAAIYDISKHKTYEFDELNHATNEEPSSPSFSRDGNKMTFVSGRGDDCNIYIMDADGSNVRQLTHDYNVNPVRKDEDVVIRRNATPSFSPDGKRIIFIRSSIRRQRALPLKGEMLSHWDVYEMDIETGKERRLTNYLFYLMSKPHYLSDGKRFIFSGSGAKNDSGVGPKNFEEYEKLYQNNEIFIMDGENNVLKPAFMNGRSSTEPHVSWNDTILFLSITNEMDGLPRNPYNYDLFIFKEGKIRRLTKMQSYIFQPSISPDGSRAVFLGMKKPDEEGHSLWIVNTDGTGLTKINIPWEQLEEQGDKKAAKK